MLNPLTYLCIYDAMWVCDSVACI